MARRKKSNVQNISPENFLEKLAAFVEHIKKETTEPEEGRQRFPEFKLTEDIRESIRGVQSVVAEEGIEKAIELLEGVRKHFACKQAAYARGLVGDLDAELQYMVTSGYHPGFSDQVRLARNEYRELVTDGWFDLDEASKLYWATIDKIEWAHAEQKKRLAEKNRVKKAVVPQDLESQRLREVQRRRQEEERQGELRMQMAEKVGHLLEEQMI